LNASDHSKERNHNLQFHNQARICPYPLLPTFLSNFGSDSQAKITFILSGQPERRARLKLAQYLPLKQRIRLFSHMTSMSLEETCRSIDHHTRIAGNPTALFSDSAKAEIHRRADGIPRIVNTVCYRSIVNATVKKLKVIDSADLYLEDPSSEA